MHTSSYYPPRARWYSRPVYWGGSLRQQLAQHRIHLPSGVAFGDLVCGILLPGYGFAARIPRRWANAIFGLCVVLLLVFFVWLGRALGNAAFTLLLSIHATSLGCVLEPWLKGTRLRFRIFISMATFFALAALLYVPIRNLIQEHWLVPLQIHGRTVIVRKLGTFKHVQRGDWLAYSISGDYRANVVVQSGIGLSPVLAKAGDRVRFSHGACQVNDGPAPGLPFVPAEGEWVLGEKEWFVWPEIAMNGHGYVGGAGISIELMEMGRISDEKCIGVPFKRWFWWDNIPK